MENILLITGKVKYPITLDPGVWIFDDRKVELDQYFSNKHEKKDEMEEYTKSVSKHWDREIMEGAIFPPTLKSEKKFLKEQIITGTFCIPLEPFLRNAIVQDGAKVLIIVTKEGEHTLSIEDGEMLVLGFSKDGKPLTEDGPVHCYFGDGSNFQNPIKNVIGFRIE